MLSRKSLAVNAFWIRPTLTLPRCAHPELNGVACPMGSRPDLVLIILVFDPRWIRANPETGPDNLGYEHHDRPAGGGWEGRIGAAARSRWMTPRWSRRSGLVIRRRLAC